MSINLHTDCEQRITEFIVSALEKIELRNKMFLTENSYSYFVEADRILPQSGKLRKELEQYVSETPLFDFLYQKLSYDLYKTQKYDSANEKSKLVELEEYKDSISVASRLVSEFKSLPWDYCLSIKLENNFNELVVNSIKNYTFSNKFRIVFADESFQQTFPISGEIESTDQSLYKTLGLKMFSAFKRVEWDNSSSYIQIFTNGFIGMYGETAPLEESIILLKSFIGLAIALRLLKVNKQYRSKPTAVKIYIHKKSENKWSFENTHDLDINISETYNDLQLNDLNESIDTDEKMIVWINKNFDILKNVFENIEKSQKIIHAGQWLFESYIGKNELLSFVQTTIAMEILLGDKALSDILGLGELLRNRCAYLIGKSQNQREAILNDFKKIYKIRSSIVHSGKNRLNNNEKYLFWKLQWMCRRVIQEEITLCIKDIERAV